MKKSMQSVILGIAFLAMPTSLFSSATNKEVITQLSDYITSPSETSLSEFKTLLSESYNTHPYLLVQERVIEEDNHYPPVTLLHLATAHLKHQFLLSLLTYVGATEKEILHKRYNEYADPTWCFPFKENISSEERNARLLTLQLLLEQRWGDPTQKITIAEGREITLLQNIIEKKDGEALPLFLAHPSLTINHLKKGFFSAIDVQSQEIIKTLIQDSPLSQAPEAIVEEMISYGLDHISPELEAFLTSQLISHPACNAALITCFFMDAILKEKEGAIHTLHESGKLTSLDKKLGWKNSLNQSNFFLLQTIFNWYKELTTEQEQTTYIIEAIRKNRLSFLPFLFEDVLYSLSNKEILLNVFIEGIMVAIQNLRRQALTFILEKCDEPRTAASFKQAFTDHISQEALSSKDKAFFESFISAPNSAHAMLYHYLLQVKEALLKNYEDWEAAAASPEFLEIVNEKLEQIGYIANSLPPEE